MRKYQLLWNTLKAQHVVTIAAHPKQHGTIKKAVIKEKWLDDGFKYLCSESGNKYYITVQITGNTMQFQLTDKSI